MTAMKLSTINLHHIRKGDEMAETTVRGTVHARIVGTDQVEYLVTPFVGSGNPRTLTAKSVETAILDFESLFDLPAEKSAAVKDMLRRARTAVFDVDFDPALIPKFVLMRA